MIREVPEQQAKIEAQLAAVQSEFLDPLLCKAATIFKTASRRKLTGDHCQCSRNRGCGEYFNSTYAFDCHRTGTHGVDRRCLTELEMLQRGMAKNAGGWWISGAMRDSTLAARQGAYNSSTPLPPTGVRK